MDLILSFSALGSRSNQNQKRMADTQMNGGDGDMWTGETKRSLELEDGAYHVLETMPNKRLRHDAYSYCPPGNTPSRLAPRCHHHLLAAAAAGDHNNNGDNASKEEQNKKKRRALDQVEEKPESAIDDGVYDVSELTKRFKCEYMADPRRATFLSKGDAEEAKLVAMHLRATSIVHRPRRLIREIKAMADAAAQSGGV